MTTSWGFSSNSAAAEIFSSKNVVPESRPLRKISQNSKLIPSLAVASATPENTLRAPKVSPSSTHVLPQPLHNKDSSPQGRCLSNILPRSNSREQHYFRQLCRILLRSLLIQSISAASYLLVIASSPVTCLLSFHPLLDGSSK